MIETWLHLDTPYYLSLGSLGHIIGHEMGHALLTKKLLTGLFSPETTRTYLEKRDCLSQPFSDISQTNKSVNGANVLFKVCPFKILCQLISYCHNIKSKFPF
jgi:hypothetical protein